MLGLDFCLMQSHSLFEVLAKVLAGRLELVLNATVSPYRLAIIGLSVYLNSFGVFFWKFGKKEQSPKE